MYLENVKQLPRVSVIIPMLNEENHIRQCLNSVIDQKYPHDLMEILVVDGRSQDRSREIVSRISKNVTNIRIIDNQKVSTANGLNKGISESKGSIIVRVDAHDAIESDYIYHCVMPLMQKEADNAGGIRKPVGTNFIGKLVALAIGSRFGVGSHRFADDVKQKYVDTVSFGCYRREIFAKIGMYDENLPYGEDDELNYRLIKHGGKILLSPKIKSHYFCRPTLTSLWKQYYNFGYGKIRTLKKHGNLSSFRHFIPSLFVLSLLFCIILSGFLADFFIILLLILGSYLGISLIVSISISLKKGWRYLFLLPVAFGVIHFSYGIGFLHGFLNLVNIHRIFELVIRQIRFSIYNLRK